MLETIMVCCWYSFFLVPRLSLGTASWRLCRLLFGVDPYWRQSRQDWVPGLSPGTRILSNARLIHPVDYYHGGSENKEKITTCYNGTDTAIQ
jgi:hypothetical protein